LPVERIVVAAITGNPTVAPVAAITGNPTDAPVVAITDKPTVAPVPAAQEGCLCDKDDETDMQSWKCGNDVYICPDVERICSVQPSQNSVYYRINQDECDEMKTVEIGEKCLKLPGRINNAKGLSNRVCYSNTEGTNGFNGMKEDGSCDVCNYSVLASELLNE